jgi:uncharacterized protein YeaO (DUF488 family)
MSVLFTPDLYERVVTASCMAPAARAPNTARVLVTRFYPAQASHGFFHAWWDHLAPARDVSQAYRCGALDWAEFAYTYLAGLEADARWRSWVASDVARLLSQFDTVCLIGAGSPGWRGEADVRCHRRLLWAWLVGADITFS